MAESTQRDYNGHCTPEACRYVEKILKKHRHTEDNNYLLKDNYCHRHTEDNNYLLKDKK